MIRFLDKTDKKYKKRRANDGELLKKPGFCAKIKPSRIFPDIIFIPVIPAKWHSNRKRKGKS